MTELKVHWSFWVVCLVALIWNVMGCINFIMQMNPETLANYPAAVKSFVAGRPAWAGAAFAIAMFTGALGVILLWLKKSAAFYLFSGSIAGVLVTNIHIFLVGASKDIWIGGVMSLGVAAFLICYTQYVKRKGWIS